MGWWGLGDSRRIGYVIGVALTALLMAACGDSDARPPAPSDEPAVTTTLVPEAQVGGITPAPKPSTTTTSTTTTVPATAAPLELPAGFPRDLPLPSGQVGYYTGSPQLGFHVNISTSMRFSELVRFFTEGLEAHPAWDISVRNIGQGFLAGYEELWAVYTAQDHVLTQLAGEYPGVIEIEGRHVNILLDAPAQPEPGVEPSALPPLDELPRPAADLVEARYSSGLVQTEYAGGVTEFIELLTEYRNAQWVELGVTDPFADTAVAVGELGKWRVTIRSTGETIELDFEDRSLSYP